MNTIETGRVSGGIFAINLVENTRAQTVLRSAENVLDISIKAEGMEI